MKACSKMESRMDRVFLLRKTELNMLEISMAGSSMERGSCFSEWITLYLDPNIAGNFLRISRMGVG